MNPPPYFQCYAYVCNQFTSDYTPISDPAHSASSKYFQYYAYVYLQPIYTTLPPPISEPTHNASSKFSMLCINMCATNLHRITHPSLNPQCKLQTLNAMHMYVCNQFTTDFPPTAETTHNEKSEFGNTGSNLVLEHVGHGRDPHSNSLLAQLRCQGGQSHAELQVILQHPLGPPSLLLLLPHKLYWTPLNPKPCSCILVCNHMSCSVSGTMALLQVQKQGDKSPHRLSQADFRFSATNLKIGGFNLGRCGHCACKYVVRARAPWPRTWGRFCVDKYFTAMGPMIYSSIKSIKDWYGWTYVASVWMDLERA